MSFQSESYNVPSHVIVTFYVHLLQFIPRNTLFVCNERCYEFGTAPGNRRVGKPISVCCTDTGMAHVM